MLAKLETETFRERMNNSDSKFMILIFAIFPPDHTILDYQN